MSAPYTQDELIELAREVVLRDIEIRFIHAAGACWWPADECPYWDLHERPSVRVSEKGTQP